MPPAATDPAERKLVSVISPVFNEAATLEEFVRRLAEAVEPLAADYRFEFILVDDGSRDESLALAKKLLATEPRLRVVELRRNFGQTAALQAGIDLARGELLVTMDSDLQHFPEEIPDFLAKIEEGYDLVCGWRKDRREGQVRKFPSRVANRLIRSMSGLLEIHDIGTTFRAYRQDLIKSIPLLGDQHRFIPVLAHHAGARITELPIANIVRPEGQSSYGLSRTFSVSVDLVYLYFFLRYLHHPIKAFGKLALAFFAIGSAILTGLVVYAYVLDVAAVRERSGWFIVSIFFLLTSVQMLIAGVLAELIVRIYLASVGHGPYRIRREWSSRDL